MRLSKLADVMALTAEAKRLADTLVAIEADQVQVVIQQRYQDDAMNALVRPVLLREIEARLHRVGSELRRLGVEVDVTPG